MPLGRGHPEKIIDWGFRSIHLMTEAARHSYMDLRT